MTVTRFSRIIFGALLLLIGILIGLFFLVISFTSFSHSAEGFELYTAIAIPVILIIAGCILFSKLQGAKFVSIGMVLFIALLPTLGWFTSKGTPLWFYSIPIAIAGLWLIVGIIDKG